METQLIESFERDYFSKTLYSLEKLIEWKPSKLALTTSKEGLSPLLAREIN